MMWGGYQWGWPGIVLAAVFMVACVALMGRMMGHGRMSNHMNHGHGLGRQSPARHGTDVSEHLERRLVNGEIDIDEYYRLRDLLADIGGPSNGGEGVSGQH
ncbi:MAG TPA: hypothetical protein VFR23_23365 [Jiangellaceae bacterium]|nr:hypothetical protein [Jiangellaceae bacterium]